MSETKNELATIESKKTDVALFKEIPIVNGLLEMKDLGAIHEFSRLAIASGVYEDMDSVAKGTMKIVYGLSLGLTPQESLNSVYFLKGRASVYSQLIAQKIKESGIYDYKILQSDAKCCKLQVLTNKEIVGTEEYTWEQAVALKVTGKPAWLADPALMLFYKCITRVYKKYCGNVFKIAVQSVEDMSDVDTTIIANEINTPGTNAPEFAKAVDAKAKKKASSRAKEEQPPTEVEDVEDAQEVEDITPTEEDRTEAKKEVFEENGMPDKAEAIQAGIDKVKAYVPDLQKVLLFGSGKKWKIEHIDNYIKTVLKKEADQLTEEDVETLKAHVRTNAPAALANA